MSRASSHRIPASASPDFRRLLAQDQIAQPQPTQVITQPANVLDGFAVFENVAQEAALDATGRNDSGPECLIAIRFDTAKDLRYALAHPSHRNTFDLLASLDELESVKPKSPEMRALREWLLTYAKWAREVVEQRERGAA